MTTTKNSSKPVLTFTKIRQVLRSLVFNPRKPGLMKVIAETGNEDYYLLRALENLQQSVNLPTNRVEAYKLIIQAIRLLVLWVAKFKDQ